MNRSTLSFAALIFVACSSDSPTGDPPGDDGGPTPTSLPCDVAAVVEAHCTSCHGDPLRSGAPQALFDLDHWLAEASTVPGQSNGGLSVVRMGDTSQPMPPAGVISEQERTVIAEWVAAGMPGGECTVATPADAALDAEPVCTSMELWPFPEHHPTGYLEEEMFPGMPCIDCHVDPFAYQQSHGGPVFDLGGTVFHTAHEPDNCFGVDGATFTDVIVHIEDSTGATWDLPVNAAGNFFLDAGGLVPPYSAKVINDDGVRAMSLKPTDGDCNTCHTADGSSGADPAGPVAPGRIVVP